MRCTNLMKITLKHLNYQTPLIIHDHHHANPHIQTLHVNIDTYLYTTRLKNGSTRSATQGAAILLGERDAARTTPLRHETSRIKMGGPRAVCFYLFLCFY